MTRSSSTRSCAASCAKKPPRSNSSWELGVWSWECNAPSLLRQLPTPNSKLPTSLKPRLEVDGDAEAELPAQLVAERMDRFAVDGGGGGDVLGDVVGALLGVEA